MELRSAMLFDFDGLICDTERAAYLSWTEVFDHYEVTFSKSLWQQMTGRPDGAKVAAGHLSKTAGVDLPHEVLTRRLERKRQLAEQEPLRPGVLDLLTWSRANELIIGVVSSSARAWVRGHLQRLSVLSYFSEVITSEDAENHKPSPDLYLAALERLQADPSRSVAIEDSATGVAAARAAKVTCIAVPSEVGDADGLSDADVVLDSLEHVDRDWLRARLSGTG